MGSTLVKGRPIAVQFNDGKVAIFAQMADSNVRPLGWTWAKAFNGMELQDWETMKAELKARSEKRLADGLWCDFWGGMYQYMPNKQVRHIDWWLNWMESAVKKALTWDELHSKFIIEVSGNRTSVHQKDGWMPQTEGEFKHYMEVYSVYEYKGVTLIPRTKEKKEKKELDKPFVVQFIDDYNKKSYFTKKTKIVFCHTVYETCAKKMTEKAAKSFVKKYQDKISCIKMSVIPHPQYI